MASCCSSKPANTANNIHNSVQDYYGKVLQKSQDLKTNACTTSGKPPLHIRKALSLIHEEVSNRYYGCGLVVPEVLDGMRILDLGCGAGRDCFLLSKLVGKNGSVVGVDMTKEQLDVANSYIDYHTKQFGYDQPNVSFRHGYIENLEELGLEANSFDIIISNCVINLSPDKESVLKGAFRVLKPGGEIYFSDVYADRRVPRDLVNNPVLFGECLSGALYWNDFLNLAKKCGFADPRQVNDSVITISNEQIQDLIGHINFFSVTYRLFKIDNLEPACEDYGQAVIYNGKIDTCPKAFILDAHHTIETGKVFPVCGNTYRMLNETRFAPYFQFIGDFTTHYGIFSGCGVNIPYSSSNSPTNITKSSCC